MSQGRYAGGEGRCISSQGPLRRGRGSYSTVRLASLCAALEALAQKPRSNEMQRPSPTGDTVCSRCGDGRLRRWEVSYSTVPSVV